jgi:hypothetical protein
MKHKQKWMLFSGFLRIYTGSHEFDPPCSGSQSPAFFDFIYLNNKKKSLSVRFCAIIRTRNFTGTKLLETFNRFPRIVMTCIVQMHHDAFQGLSLAMCAYIFNKSDTMESQNDTLLYAIPLSISSRLCILLTDQMIKIRYFSVSIFDWVFREPHIAMRPRLLHIDI